MAMLGLRFCARAFSSCGKRGPLFIAVRGPLLLRSTGSRRTGSVIVAHGPSCSVACGIFPDQGSNPCPLHWQADSQPLCHQGSPRTVLFYEWIIFYYMDIPDLFIHASAKGYLGCFHFSAIINNAAMNIPEQVLEWTYVFISPGRYLGVGLLGHLVTPCLTFWGTAKFFPEASAPLNLDTCNIWEF